MPSRDDFKQLAIERLRDSEVLFSADRYDAAAEMCGYVVEFALKACVCKRLRIETYPENEIERTFKTHNFDQLLLLAGLKTEIELRKKDTLLNWSVVAGWKPEWRYERRGIRSRDDTARMIQVLNAEILPWLKKRW